VAAIARHGGSITKMTIAIDGGISGSVFDFIS